MKFLANKEKYLKLILEGAIFIHPTDTIYGIGCNAKKPNCIKQIRKIKNGKKGPLSVIAPGEKWITENVKIPKKYLEKLPGAYTIIAPMRKKCVSVECARKSLGVRIPNNWFSAIIEEVGVPIVTTSVN